MPDNPQLRWVSWAAVSSLPQAKKVSIDDQLQINREHCARHGGQLVAELVVPGESRSIVLFEDAARKMNAYARLKELIDGRAFDVLVYLDSSRLGRIGALVMAVRALCQQAGVICYETDNPPANLDQATGYDDQLIGAIKAVGAQHEVTKFMERSKSGKIGRARAGKMQAAPPYGYRLEWPAGARADPVYIIDDAQAATVRRVFAAYLDGQGQQTICDALSADGVPTPDGLPTWGKSSLRHLLTRVWIYAGYAEVNRLSRAGRPYVRAVGTWPPIIDARTAQRIIDERAARVQNRHLSDTHLLLTGVCVCAVCGANMHVTYQQSRGKVYQYWYVRCKRHDPTVTYSCARIVEFLRVLMTTLQGADIAALAAEDDDGDRLQAQLARQVATLERIAASLRQVDNRYFDGTLDADRYSYQLDRLHAQRTTAATEAERLRQAIATETARGTRHARLLDAAASGLARLDHADKTYANAWLRQTLRVYVGTEGIERAEWL
jgi:DNA invertase Pin-like site-specific DNA recombinase